jgi:hypothetical protein
MIVEKLLPKEIIINNTTHVARSLTFLRLKLIFQQGDSLQLAACITAKEHFYTKKANQKLLE